MAKRKFDTTANDTDARDFRVTGSIFLKEENRYPEIGEIIQLSPLRAEALLALGLIAEVDDRQANEAPADE